MDSVRMTKVRVLIDLGVNFAVLLLSSRGNIPKYFI
jgi:hypothetical protein